MQWLNDSGEVKVTKQVVVPFSIGKYVDEVLCDVVPIKQVTCWGGHGNMIGRQLMPWLKIGIPMLQVSREWTLCFRVSKQENHDD